MEKSIAQLIKTDFADIRNDRCFGFYDWFCKDTSLLRKSKTLIAKLTSILKNNKRFDPTKCYVFFKNNCPLKGGLYDDFRICDIETGNVLYTVAPRNPHFNGKASVWGIDNDFNGPLVTGSWIEIKRFFAEKPLSSANTDVD
jgi:hypothetical protein